MPITHRKTFLYCTPSQLNRWAFLLKCPQVEKMLIADFKQYTTFLKQITNGKENILFLSTCKVCVYLTVQRIKHTAGKCWFAIVDISYALSAQTPFKHFSAGIFSVTHLKPVATVFNRAVEIHGYSWTYDIHLITRDRDVFINSQRRAGLGLLKRYPFIFLLSKIWFRKMPVKLFEYLTGVVTVRLLRYLSNMNAVFSRFLQWW